MFCECVQCSSIDSSVNVFRYLSIELLQQNVSCTLSNIQYHFARISFLFLPFIFTANPNEVHIPHICIFAVPVLQLTVLFFSLSLSVSFRYCYQVSDLTIGFFCLADPQGFICVLNRSTKQS